MILPSVSHYFVGALIYYKEQILYVYTPCTNRENCNPWLSNARSLALFVAQMTLLVIIIIRGYYQPIFLPTPSLVTLWTMNYFEKTYAEPSTRLSLEELEITIDYPGTPLLRNAQLDSAAVADPLRNVE
jgi:hypothetical protein